MKPSVGLALCMFLGLALGCGAVAQPSTSASGPPLRSASPVARAAAQELPEAGNAAPLELRQGPALETDGRPSPSREAPPPRLSDLPPPTSPYVRDDAQVIPARVTAQITRQVKTLEGKAEIFVVTKVLDDMSLFDQASQATFKEIVREVSHYRVIVVFIAYSRDRAHGIISTNLGAGVWHIVPRQECEELFGNSEAALTVDRVQTGVDFLVAKILAHHRSQPVTASGPGLLATVTQWLSRPALWLALALMLGVGVLFARRVPMCPGCHAPLKTRVSIGLGVGNSSRSAKKTLKCFRCGYSRRQDLFGLGPLESLRRLFWGRSRVSRPSAGAG